MSKLKIGKDEWVVVCDGAKALVLRNAGDELAINLKTVEVYEQPDPRTHELGTDAPGRSFGSVGSARSAVEQTDWHDQAEQTFLHALLARLDIALGSGKAKKLIMVAPPRALGVLRQSYSAQIRNALHAEITKDLVKLPIHEIENHLIA